VQGLSNVKRLLWYAHNYVTEAHHKTGHDKEDRAGMPAVQNKRRARYIVSLREEDRQECLSYKEGHDKEDRQECLSYITEVYHEPSHS